MKKTMPSVQYIIDSLCASVTVECVYTIIEALLSEGPIKVAEILPLIQAKDRSLDATSAQKIAEAALSDLAKRGVIQIEGGLVHSRKTV